MINLSKTTTNILKRLGSPATVKWPNKALGSSNVIPPLATSCFIDTSGSLLGMDRYGSDATKRKVAALMPVTERDLTGATVEIGTKRYTVQSAETIPNAVQIVVLV